MTETVFQNPLFVCAGGSFLPREGKLDPGESFRIKVKYRARAASESEGDVKAVATFIKKDSEEKIESEATLTAAKVVVTPSSPNGFTVRQMA